MLPFFAVFYWSTYCSVSLLLPSAIPIHHDDYTNYSAVENVWTWVRPLSTLLIERLAGLGPNWLIWSVRLLSVTYVCLAWKIVAEVIRRVVYWPVALLFAVAVFSTPISVEYARYTGMITHMLSGCLVLAAVFCLFKEERQGARVWLILSASFLILSVLAKEDFVLFYAFSLAYILIQTKRSRTTRLFFGLSGLFVSVLFLAISKYFVTSTFLGVSDVGAPYFIDASPLGVMATVWRYLTGAGQPVMIGQGHITAGLFIFSIACSVIIAGVHKKFPKSLFAVGASLSVIAPYSILLNHVNPYYELIWLPLLIGGAYLSLLELLSHREFKITTTAGVITFLAFLALVINISIIDYPGRQSVAGWYD